jgi:type I restriction enzyme S subunit
MEVRKGYKQTDVGVVPEEWDVRRFDEVVSVRKQKIPPQMLSVPLFCVELDNIEQGSGKLICNIEIENIKSIKSVFRTGDVLFGKLRAYLRKYWLADRDGICSTEIWALIANPSQITERYLFHLIQTDRFVDVATMAYGTHMPRTDWNVVKEYTFSLPPLPEQQAIATALSDVDALLTSLDALIAKKHLIKQGAMQELLTGKKRLPGFGGKWEVKSLGNLFDFSGGFTASRDQLSSEGYCYLHYGDIHKSNKTYIDVSAEFQDIPKLNVSLKKISEVSLLKDGDVVFVDASEDDEGASKHVVVDNPDGIPFISGLHTIVAKSKTEDLAHLYRRYCFQTRAVKNQFLFYAVGTKVTGISKSNIAKINIPVPSLPEQTAIAEILSDMDAEIAALEARREKTRLLKQGMMQELLTGRIRLV